MSDVLISIIMSVYNETIDELNRSINSILDQSYKNIQFIIVDDNPDNKKLVEYLNNIKDKRVILLKNKVNKGLVYSLNKALTYCRGEYVARMDADDYSYVDRLEKEKVFLEKNNYDLVGCFDVEVSNSEKKHYRKPIYCEEVAKILKKRNCLSHPTWLVKKDVYNNLNGYREIKYCEDYDFLLRAINNNYKIGNCPEYLLEHYIRESSISIPNKCLQLLITNYLAERKANINVDELNSYICSNEVKREIELFNKCSVDLKKKKMFSLLSNKWFYKRLLAKVRYKLNI